MRPLDVQDVTTLTMDFFDNRYYRVNKILSSCTGTWPLQSTKRRCFFGTTTVILVWSIFIPKLIAVYTYLGDVKSVIDCLPVLTVHTRTLLKFGNTVIKSNTMKQLTIKIRENWAVKTADFEEAIMHSYAERGKLISVAYAAYLYSALYVYLLLPVIPIVMDVFVPLNESRQKIYLYETEYFVDRDKNYYYLLVHAYMSMPASLGIIVAYDAMFAVYVQHCCCLFAILGARLENLGKYSGVRQLNLRSKPNDNEDETYGYIVDCIKIHKEAIEYARLVEASGTENYVMIVGISMFAVTLTGFMTVKNLNEPSEALRFGTFAFGEIAHLFYLCWQGHTLMKHSEDIFINAYNVDWYDLSAPSKKLLIMIMMRSLEPCRLTAGKVFVMSMENYATLLKTSMSYFTVLLSMQ